MDIRVELVVGHFFEEAFQMEDVRVLRFVSARAFSWWDYSVQSNAAAVAWTVRGVLVEDVNSHNRRSDLEKNAVCLIGVCRIGNPTRFGGDRRLICPPLERNVVL